MKGSDVRIFSAAALAAALAACVPAGAPPAPLPPGPAPTPAPVSRPAPTLPIAPRFDNWADAPQTEGVWRYGTKPGVSEAVFVGTGNLPLARLRCEMDQRMIILSLAESGSPRPVITIRTHTASRTLEATPAGRETLARFEARDPLLDAMAFARGRFAIEAQGLATLYLPSWGEVSRVIEDCR
jgi:hypothetical protein